jgi:type I restriction enzyme R subunit
LAFFWEQRKLGEYVSITSGEAPSKFDKGTELYVKVDDLNYNDKYVVDTQNKVAEHSTVKRVTKGSVVFPKRGAAIMTNKVRIMGIDSYMDTNMMALTSEKLDSEFLYNIISKEGLYKIADTSTIPQINNKHVEPYEVTIPSLAEQRRIGAYFKQLDHFITLHQCKHFTNCNKNRFAWEQRKFKNIVERLSESYMSDDKNPSVEYEDIISELGTINKDIFNKRIRKNGIKFSNNEILYGKLRPYLHNWLKPDFNGIAVGDWWVLKPINCDREFIFRLIQTSTFDNIANQSNGTKMPRADWNLIANSDFYLPISIYEQKQIGSLFSKLDHLITLHQHKLNILKDIKKYMIFGMLNIEGGKNMPELESIIEKNLIDQLALGDSQWTYRPDLKSEKDLWDNFRYILEQNNKDRLNGQPLSDNEFEQVKNQLQFSSFYKAGEWLVGENGKVMVHVQRDTEKLHLVVMNHEHIAGGSSVYEVINQYSTLQSDKENGKDNNSRFDVTLMINGLPMIHIELKNKSHPYMEAFNQIKRYIGEGKFTGIFSAVQMFVVSNGVDTKYFSAASDTELNPKFMSGWLDEENNPVTDYIDFAKSVLSIPQAHEMIARYTVLDEDSKRLILLRPYQIHAIEAIRESSKQGKSGYVWHTTGSGKTLTSYKATRNLLMDIPSIDKTIFLIDRKDLDAQTTLAFQAYANNDLVDVDETENVNDLKKKLKSDDRQVIVTTIQKLQRLVTKRLKEDTPEYNKIRNLKLGFIVDECHRAVTPATKRELERFFKNSLWFGFTGTPRFDENSYQQMGDLPRTTEALYGKCLHKYTIMNAIHDNAVLGFQVEHNGPKNIDDETDSKVYENEKHMLKVLDVIINKSYHKLGFQNGKGKTYVGLLTTSSIQQAQKYYELLTKVKNGETPLVIDEKIKQVLPDFPKFAITYSVSENKDNSMVNQDKMKKSIDDYNRMFGTKFDISQIQSYNGNLNKRLARKDSKYKSRNEQLDLVIVVDRLLTGFDAPCMSTIYIDRQPMGPHDLIQAFSRTNRIFDKNKAFGQIVTFQAPVLFKECVDNAVKLYSAGGTKESVLAEWNVVEPAFKKALSALRVSAEKPEDIASMSEKEKKIFVKIFQEFDTLFAQLKSFTNYDDSMLKDYGITEEEYNDYVGHYKNVVEELKKDPPDGDEPNDEIVDQEYELMAYSNTKIDYEYIISLIQNIVTPSDDDENLFPEERKKKIDEIKSFVEDLRKDNPKIADIMSTLVSEIENDEEKYKGRSILNVVENMRQDCIDRVITDFCDEWKTSKEDVMYVAENYRNGTIINESAIKATSNYSEYKESQEKALPKFKYYSKMMTELRKVLEEEIKPLNHN